ncbi:3-phosphoserine/phosphohydroxythreonine transaminase [Cyanobium sp. HWJ4-Hawea]|uniref:3-phosphoserine/phosphohydroxythreonine transaminase n=1 Tax=Cyanobium sp. HWJ4-Hawea TaxID=2823713 RepID=UPI0020CE9A89|nr:3-phosphoserine/phosphohydroxythreonine transaminase [Cyanobium sp. HWJ4-Hawea]MCP9808956.1 3-phosphoserine/phosphohydroxythreonine transaminase [Cyanobium sp. HWJ4-Hawea]
MLDRNSHNFSAGPGALPDTVLEQLSAEMLSVPELGVSLLGISHRSEWFESVVLEVEERLRNLLYLTEDWNVILMQGGSSLQFGMIPMNLLPAKGSADYLRTGYWSGRSIADPRLFGSINLAWDGEPWEFRRLPRTEELQLNEQAAYFHYVSNETVEGLQFQQIPGIDGVTRICDMSSDFLSRPIAIKNYDLIYAHAQKNLGPAGLTIVLIRDSLLERLQRPVPTMLDYRNHRDHQSIFNTPPTFAIYATLLVLRWLENTVGGLRTMEKCNKRKAMKVYGMVDESDGFYMGRAARDDRSLMNVCFNLEDKLLEPIFLQEATKQGFEGLKGHRSIGGMRASLYNAVSESACEDLCELMTNFRIKHRKGRVQKW